MLTQASREELQAALETVNAELQRKIGQLDQAQAELEGLFSATPVAIVSLDPQLHVVRYTPAATGLLNLREADVGRPITHLNPSFVGLDFRAALERLLVTREPFEHEVQSRDGRNAFIARGVPHHGPTGKLRGLVLTFTNVTALKTAERERRDNE